MNRLFLIFMLAFATMLSFTSCEREAYNINAENGNGSQGDLAQGQLNLASLKVGVNVDAVTRAGVDISDFIIYIYADGGTNPIKEWVYKNMPEVFALNVGSYRLEVWSHVPEDAAWEKPYYYGSKSFDILKDTFTDLGIVTCRLSNIKTTVEIDDALKEVMGADTKISVIANQVESAALEFVKTETRAGYFKAINADANVLATTLSGTIDGVSYNKTTSFPGIKKGEHRKLIFTYKGSVGDTGDGGQPNFGIEIDVTCEIVEIPVDVNPGGDEEIDDFPSGGGDGGNTGGGDGGNTGGGDGGNTNENAPSIVGTNFGGSPFDIDQPQVVRGAVDLIVTLAAPKGIAHVHVTIDSDKLTPEVLTGVNLTDKFDLAYPGAYEVGLKGLGFPTGSDVIGQTELLFNITQFTPLLGIYGAGTHNFIIEVIDEDNVSVTKTLTLITE